jgi:mRNA interferase RelE/StbE
LEIAYKPSFEKKLLKMPKHVQETVFEIIEDLEKAKSLGELKRVEKIAGFKDFYKIRFGNYRLGIQYIEPLVIIITVLKRDERTYKDFPPK